ncbi:hypothetical protein D3C72_1017230 [compost metagenome]
MDHRRHHQQRDHDQRQEEPQADQPQHHQCAIQQAALRRPAHHHRDAAAVLVADHHPGHVQVGRYQRTQLGGAQCRQAGQQRRVDGRQRAALQPCTAIIHCGKPQVAAGTRVELLPACFIQHQPAAFAVHGVGRALGHEHVHAPGVLVAPGQDQRDDGEQHREGLRQEQPPRQPQRDRTDRSCHLRPPPAGSRRRGSRGSPRLPRPAAVPCAALRYARLVHWTGSHHRTRTPPLPAHCG